MFELTALQWAQVIMCAFLVGTVKAGISGLGMVIIPTMASVFPAKASTGILLPMLIMGDVFAVIYYRRHADWKVLAKLLPSAVVGIAIGYLLMDRISDLQLKRGIGAIVLTFISLTVLRELNIIRDDRIPRGWPLAVAAGTIAGVTTMLANAAGPIMLVYLLAMGFDKNRFIGTAAWFFMLVNWIKVPFSVSLGLIDLETVLFDIRLLPVILAGAAVGVLIVKAISNRGYRLWIQVIAAVMSLRLLFATAPGGNPAPTPAAEPAAPSEAAQPPL